MDCSGGATSSNWTEVVEDLLHDGDIDKATSHLESTVSNLEKQLSENERQFKNTDKNSQSFSVDQLFTALQDLSKLYSAKGLSLKADQTLSRAIQLKHQKGGAGISDESIAEGSHEALVSHNEATTYDKIREHGFNENASNVNGSSQEGSVDDDWEAIADHTPEELLPQQCLPKVSTLSLEDSKDQATKRRGRGTFAYKRQGLYSDNQSDEPEIDRPDINSIHHGEDVEKGNLIYGSRHVLVLADFPPSTRTSDLEKLFEKFKDQFVIRWVNDTTALAVFRTPSVAQEASISIQCSFTMRILEEGDELLSSIPSKDLKPPRQRPQTSARTAQRLIAQGMGIKLPSNFGSTEFRKQEDARKNRIVSRHNMRDDAWGDE